MTHGGGVYTDTGVVDADQRDPVVKNDGHTAVTRVTKA